MKSKKDQVLDVLDALAQKLEQQRVFETYEYMERPEISVFAKGRATAYQNSLSLLNGARERVAGLWLDKKCK